MAIWLAMQILKSPLTFGAEILFKLVACMHCESIGSFKDQSYTIGYIPQLNEIEELLIELVFFNGFELFVKLELFRSSYFSSKSCFY